MKTEIDEREPNYYTVIPNYIIFDDTLIPKAILLYGAITSLCNDKGFCWASNKYFAKKFKTHKTTINKWLNQLKNEGHISIKIKNNNTRKIYLTIVKGGVAKKQRGGCQKAKGGLPKSKALYNKIIDKDKKKHTVVDKPRQRLISDISDKKDKYYKKSIRLYNSLKKKNKIFRKININNWNKQLRTFYNDSKLDKKLITEVLKWYCENIGKEFVPHAYSASSFCERFASILDAKERDIKEKENVIEVEEVVNIHRKMVDGKYYVRKDKKSKWVRANSRKKANK